MHKMEKWEQKLFWNPIFEIICLNDAMLFYAFSPVWWKTDY